MSYTTLQLKTFSFELIYCFKMCFEIFFAQCKKNTRQRASLPSVKKTLGKELLCRVSKKTLGKGVFAECPKNNTRQTTWHSAKSRSLVVYLKSQNKTYNLKQREYKTTVPYICCLIDETTDELYFLHESCTSTTYFCGERSVFHSPPTYVQK